MEVENTKMEWWQLIILIIVVGLIVDDFVTKICNAKVMIEREKEKKKEPTRAVVYESKTKVGNE